MYCTIVYYGYHREEMMLELRNETAALKAQLELQAQEVNALLEYLMFTPLVMYYILL